MPKPNHLSSYIFICLLSFGCVTMPKQTAEPRSDSALEKKAPFEYAGSHLLKIPVTINDSIQTNFIFDTGIGVNLLSKNLCQKLQCKITDTHKGKRMSGQEVSIPMSSISSLSFASQKQDNVAVGVWDMKGFLPPGPEFDGVEGFLSLNFFKNLPFTIDYKQGLILLEDKAGLEARKAEGVTVPISIHDDGKALTIFMSLKIPGGEPIIVEIDLGGNILTLHEKYMKQLDVNPESSDVKTQRAKDETGFFYLRYFGKIAGPIHPKEAPELKQVDLSVMFQDIIYDGLIGNSFMKQFITTYDLANSQLILTKI